jgi:hypothetical protein
MGVSMGIYSLLSPFNMTAMYGVPAPPPLSSGPSITDKASSKDSSMAVSIAQGESQNCILAFARAKGARDLSSGMVYYGLIWLGNQKALGILMIANVMTAVTDGAVVYQQGDKQTAWGHWVAASIIAATGTWIIWTTD